MGLLVPVLSENVCTCICDDFYQCVQKFSNIARIVEIG